MEILRLHDLGGRPVRVCDWIAEHLHSSGIRRIYGLMGGGAAGLNDGFIKHGGLEYICFHHEQGAGHAATAEAKVTGKLAVVNPTTGCGGTNCMTSLLIAWQDGLPVLFLSGNVRKDQMSHHINLSMGTRIRKYGIQEHDIIETVSSTTKYAAVVSHASHVEMHLERAIAEATSGRPGPVWLDVPSDIQTAMFPAQAYLPNPAAVPKQANPDSVAKVLSVLRSAERPVVIAGQGIKQSGTIALFKELVERLEIPFVSSYGARDLVPYDHPLNIGAIGLRGSRAGNFAMQASDAVLVLGCSMNVMHVGYDITTWAPMARKMVVDIDQNELRKGTIKYDVAVHADLGSFLRTALEITNGG